MVDDRSERFFAWVWRLNGLLILALALIGTVGALAIAFNVSVFATREHPEDQLSEVAGTDLSAQDLRIGDFRSIAGSQFLYAPLASPSDYIGSGSSGGLGQAHNLLFFDTATKTAHWLLPNNDQIIPSYSFLMDPPGRRYAYVDGEADDRKQVAVALLVELQEKRNEEQSDAGSRSLAIASPEGRGLTPIAPSIQGLLGHHHARKDSLFVFYVSSGTARVLDVDPVTRTLRSDTPLATQQ